MQGGLVNPGCIVEVDVIALSGDADLRREPLGAESIPQSPLAESVAVRAGNWLFFGGQLATDYKTGVAPAARIDPNFPRYETAIKRQGNYILDNVATLLEELGSSVPDVVHLWGFVPSDEVRRAYRVAAENVPGVKRVKNHLRPMPASVGMGY